MKIAVLALQGAFIEHIQVLRHLGVETMEIRQLSDWLRFSESVSSFSDANGEGLILPGGESTVQMRLLSQLRLLEPVREAILGGMPVFGTCAGMILLSESHLATMDIRVRRNAYGRQLGSFHTVGPVEGLGDNIPMTFIRAPYIEEVTSSKCKAVATVDGHVVAARQGNQLATAFHPELDDDLRLHQFFLKLIASRPA